MCPKIFQQSYSLHAVIDGKCLPLVFALQSDKTGKTYAFFLNIIKNSVCNITDGIIMVDFEKAAMNAFRSVFEQFNLMNCFFHLCQSVQKRISKSFRKLGSRLGLTAVAQGGHAQFWPKNIKFAKLGQNQANGYSTCSIDTLSTRISFFLKLDKTWLNHESQRNAQIWARPTNFIVSGLFTWSNINILQ